MSVDQNTRSSICFKKCGRAFETPSWAFETLSSAESLKSTAACLCYNWPMRSELLHYWLYCSCSILFPSVYTSLFMFQLISFSPHFIDHVSFLSPQSISFISFTFQAIMSLETNDLRVSLDKFLILDRYSLP